MGRLKRLKDHAFAALGGKADAVLENTEQGAVRDVALLGRPGEQLTHSAGGKVAAAGMMTHASGCYCTTYWVLSPRAPRPRKLRLARRRMGKNHWAENSAHLPAPRR